MDEQEKIKQQEIFNLISEFTGQNNIITAPRIFVKTLNSLPQAILLNQLIYWQDKMKGEWLFKTYETWEEEIGLSKYEIRKATKKFKELGFLETIVKKAAGSPTVHYKLDKNKFMDWFVKILTF